jgi:hypothetical protein
MRVSFRARRCPDPVRNRTGRAAELILNRKGNATMKQTADTRATAALNDRELDTVNGGVSFSEIVATGRKFLAATTLAGHFGDYLASKQQYGVADRSRRLPRADLQQHRTVGRVKSAAV